MEYYKMEKGLRERERGRLEVRVFTWFGTMAYIHMIKFNRLHFYYIHCVQYFRKLQCI